MLQQKFTEVINTPFLWASTLLELRQFSVSSPISQPYPSVNHPTNLRLGKQIESFVEFELEQNKDVKIISKNLQIIHNKHTLGEFDFLLEYNHKPIHLEVVYKFYIYNLSIGENELDHWIGPNNKDCLKFKLEKLKNKQLPLLYKKEVYPYLKALNIELKEIEQFVYFKAQLFTPYLSNKLNYNHINKDCIIGFYIFTSQLHLFKDFQFYMPRKHDWIKPMSEDVDWIEYKHFLIEIEKCKQKKQAPLCWINNLKGKLEKCFVYFEA